PPSRSGNIRRLSGIMLTVDSVNGQSTSTTSPRSIGCLPLDKIVVGIPAAVVRPDDPAHELVDLLLDQAVHLPGTRVDGGRGLLLRVQGLKLVSFQLNHGVLH